MNIPDKMIRMMLTILDNQDEICEACDKDAAKYVDNADYFIKLIHEKTKESDKYSTLYAAFSKLINYDFDPEVRVYHFISRNEGKHSIRTEEL